jgi:uncharacterized membrane protein
MLLGAGAMGVDVGFTVYGSRSAQAMADTAALDLVQDIPTIDAEPSPAAVQSYITTQLANVNTDNGSSAILSATPGLWYGGVWKDGITAFGSNGCAGTVFFTVPAACNAIKVTASQSAPQPFWGGFTAPSRTAIAVLGPDGGFSIGSYLASVTSPGVGDQQTRVLNALLGKLGSASVTAVGYQGMANTYFSLKDLVTASNGVLTPSNVLTTSLSGQQWLTILGNAVGNQVAQLSCGASPTPEPCNAQPGLSALNFNSSTSAQLCQMISVNGSTCTNGDVSTSALNTNLNLLQTLTTEAELANGTNAIDVTSALGLPNVSSAHLTLNLIQAPQNRYGPVGSYISASPCPAPTGFTSTCAVTAQVSSDLSMSVLDGLTTYTVDVPLSAAVGYATLAVMNCSNNMFQSMQIAASVTPATGTVTVNGSTLATITVNGKTTSLTFTTVPPTASTASAGTNPRSFSNNGTTTPTVTYSPTLTGIPGLDAIVLALLNSTLKSVLGPVLQVTGADVGGAQVAATAAGCDAISLVQ